MTNIDTPATEESSIFNLLPEVVRKNLESQGITKPTLFNKRPGEPVLAGRDVIAQSRTGSGKTLAFGLPAFARLQKPQAGGKIRILVLTPTRELAQQVADVFETNFKPQGYKVLAITGGKAIVIKPQSFKEALMP